jgi:hypothetical protein
VRKSLRPCRWRLSALDFLAGSAAGKGWFRPAETWPTNSRALGLETPCLFATPLRSRGGYKLPRTCGVRVPLPGMSIARRGCHVLPRPEGAATCQPRAKRSGAAAKRRPG